MRKFMDFPEAQNELRRDLAELGVNVHPETMQDKQIADDPDYLTKELSNYAYQVLKPDYGDIEGVHESWVQLEWHDRLQGGLNPGRAWRERPEVWEQFLERAKPKMPGRFSYTYSERMGGNYLRAIVTELEKHPHSRQLYLPVWSNQSDWRRRGVHRVPCSLGYWFVMRDNKIHLTYMMRSCDLHTHYPNDAALATIMQAWVAKESGYEMGTFTHFIGSLHVYAKDVADVF